MAGTMVARPQTSELCNCSALLQAGRSLRRRYEAAMAPAGVSLDEFLILSKLDRLGPKTISELVDLVALDRPALAYILKGMASRYLIDLEVGARDRRCRVVDLAQPGIDLLAKAQPLWKAINGRVDAFLGTRKSVALKRALKDLEHMTLT